MKYNKVYIAGAGGMLGSYVYKKFSQIAEVKATDIDVNETWLSYADVRDYTSIENDIMQFDPELIIN
jgi:dTDP-4-dehydrorhamnose reductase